MNRGQNMTKYLDRLTVSEKAVIVYLANNLPAPGFQLPKTDFHQGLVPFLPVRDVIYWLRQMIYVGPDIDYEGKRYRRLCLGILAKMTEDMEQDTGTTTFLMKLNDKKVYRRFGLHPERGKPLPFLSKEKVTVGVKWSLPKKDWIPDKDVLVSPCVTLQRIVRDGGMWEVKVSKKCYHAVQHWLYENCT